MDIKHLMPFLKEFLSIPWYGSFMVIFVIISYNGD